MAGQPLQLLAAACCHALPTAALRASVPRHHMHPLPAALQVGPMQTVEVEVDGGQRQRSGVQIERCRYLAESKCTAMCVNL